VVPTGHWEAEEIVHSLQLREFPLISTSIHLKNRSKHMVKNVRCFVQNGI
jgi:hypothetical protein